MVLKTVEKYRRINAFGNGDYMFPIKKVYTCIVIIEDRRRKKQTNKTQSVLVKCDTGVNTSSKQTLPGEIIIIKHKSWRASGYFIRTL